MGENHIKYPVPMKNSCFCLYAPINNSTIGNHLFFQLSLNFSTILNIVDCAVVKYMFKTMRTLTINCREREEHTITPACSLHPCL